MNRKSALLLLAVALAAVFSLASAQSLASLTPPGATAGMYTRNLAIKKAYFIDFQAEWNRLGISELFMKTIEGESNNPLTPEEKREIGTLLSADVFGQEGILTVYPDGGFFVLAKPAAKSAQEIIGAIRQAMKNPYERNGWLLEKNGDNPEFVIGVSNNMLMMGSQKVVERFFKGDRGYKLPIEGDFAFWVEGEPLWKYLDDPNLGLPPEAVRAIKTFGGLYMAMNIEKDGIHSYSRFNLNPDQDATLAEIFTPRGSAWPLSSLPAGVSVSSGMLDFAKLGDYASGWAEKFGSDLQLDLSAFGNRYAIIDAGSEDPQAAMQQPLGNLLLLIETKDSLTAEVTLLSWLQMLAGFASPQDNGGFAVKAIKVDGRDGKKVQIGMMGELYIVSYDDRLAVATSQKALELLSAAKLAQDPDYLRLSKMLPAQYTSAGFGKVGKALRQGAALLPFMITQQIEDPDVQRLMAEFSLKLSQFMTFVAGKTGNSISYGVHTDRYMQGKSFTEINW